MTASGLVSVEPTIQITAGNNNAYLSNVTVSGGGSGYSVTATSTSGNTYTITRGSDGTVARTCTPTTTSAASGGCVGGSW